MKKLKELISKLNVPMFGFMVFIGKIIYKGCSWQEVVAFLCVSALYGYSMYVESKTRVDFEHGITKELNELRNYVSKTNLTRGKSGSEGFKF